MKSYAVSMSGVKMELEEVFHRYTAFGADGSLTLGAWVLRAESVYVWTEN